MPVDDDDPAAHDQSLGLTRGSWRLCCAAAGAVSGQEALCEWDVTAERVAPEALAVESEEAQRAVDRKAVPAADLRERNDDAVAQHEREADEEEQTTRRSRAMLHEQVVAEPSDECSAGQRQQLEQDDVHDQRTAAKGRSDRQQGAVAGLLPLIVPLAHAFTHPPRWLKANSRRCDSRGGLSFAAVRRLTETKKKSLPLSPLSLEFFRSPGVLAASSSSRAEPSMLDRVCVAGSSVVRWSKEWAPADGGGDIVGELICRVLLEERAAAYGGGGGGDAARSHGWCACHSLNMDSTWSFGFGLLVAGSISRVDKAIPSAGVSFKACRLGVS